MVISITSAVATAVAATSPNAPHSTQPAVAQRLGVPTGVTNRPVSHWGQISALGGVNLMGRQQAGTAPHSVKNAVVQPEPRPSKLLELSRVNQAVAEFSSQTAGLDNLEQRYPNCGAKIRLALRFAIDATRGAADACATGKGSKSMAFVSCGDRARSASLTNGFNVIADELELLQSNTPEQRTRFVGIENTEAMALVFKSDPMKRIFLQPGFFRANVPEMADYLIHEISHLTLDTEDLRYLNGFNFSTGLQEGARALKRSLSDYFSELRGGVLKHDPLRNADTWSGIAIDHALACQADSVKSHRSVEKPSKQVTFKEGVAESREIRPSGRLASVKSTEIGNLNKLKKLVNDGAPLTFRDVRQGISTLVKLNAEFQFVSDDSKRLLLRTASSLDGGRGTIDQSHTAHMLLSAAFEILVSALASDAATPGKNSSNARAR